MAIRNRFWVIALAAAALLGAFTVITVAARSKAYHLRTINDQRSGRWKAKITYVQFGGGTPLARFADASMERGARQELLDVVTTYDRYIRDAGEIDQEVEVLDTPTVTLTTPRLISVYSEDLIDSGGAHPNLAYEVYSFGYVHGKPAVLKLKDLFRPGVKAVSATAPLIMKKLRANPNAAFIQDGTVKRITPEMASQFVLTRTGITFIFEPYAVSSYAYGTFYVKIPYSAFGGKLDPHGPLQGLIPE